MITTRVQFGTFLERAKLVHGAKYSYNNSNYTNTVTKINIVCNTCDSTFEQTPKMHLRGHGCPVCAGNKKNTTESFIVKATYTHGDKFNYTNVVYTNISNNVSIMCNTCGCTFLQRPDHHLAGSGCTNCHRISNDISKRTSVSNTNPTILYYVYFPEYGLWKVGCTSKQTVNARFHGETVDYIIEYEQIFIGHIAYKIEQEILLGTSKFSTDIKILRKGNSELRVVDIRDQLIHIITKYKEVNK